MTSLSGRKPATGEIFLELWGRHVPHLPLPLDLPLVLTTGALAPSYTAEGRVGVGAGGVALSCRGGPGYHPQKIFEILNAKSWILVPSWLQKLAPAIVWKWCQQTADKIERPRELHDSVVLGVPKR